MKITHLYAVLSRRLVPQLEGDHWLLRCCQSSCCVTCPLRKNAIGQSALRLLVKSLNSEANKSGVGDFRLFYSLCCNVHARWCCETKWSHKIQVIIRQINTQYKSYGKMFKQLAFITPFVFEATRILTLEICSVASIQYRKYKTQKIPSFSGWICYV